jgi:hypothetical protein
MRRPDFFDKDDFLDVNGHHHVFIQWFHCSNDLGAIAEDCYEFIVESGPGSGRYG